MERQEILRYLRRNAQETSRNALRKRLMKGLRSGSVTKEAVTEYARSTEPIPAPRTKPVTTPVVKPVPLPKTLKSLMRTTPPPRTKPPLISRKEIRMMKPTPPPQTRRTKPVPPPRTRNVKPVPPPRTRNVKPVSPSKECEHGTTEDIDGIIFCIRCGLEIDHNPLREGLIRERECQAFHVPRRKDSIFKRRTGPKKPKKDYIPISPSEVEDVLRRERNRIDPAKEQVMRCIGLWDDPDREETLKCLGLLDEK